MIHPIIKYMGNKPLPLRLKATDKKFILFSFSEVCNRCGVKE